MKPVIILVILVAYAKADDNKELQECFNQAVTFKGCIVKSINESVHANLDKLRGFQKVVAGCFDEAGVKFPSPPAAPAGARPAVPPPPPAGAHPPPQFQPNPAFASCTDGAKKAFFQCFKKEANIPEDFKPEGLQNQQQHPPPFGFGGPQNFPHDPKEIKAKLLELVGNNEEAAKKIFTCVKGQIEPYLPALIGFALPVAAACHAADACIKTQNPFTESCKNRLQQGGQAFCKCRGEFPKFFNTSSECESARSAVQKIRDEHAAAAASQADNAAAAHHNFPQHPHEMLDFCAKSPEEKCKEASANVAKIYGALGLKAPSS